LTSLLQRHKDIHPDLLRRLHHIRHKGDAWSNKPIPTADEPNDLIAVYWDDLNPPKSPAGGGVFYYYDAASNRFIVEWCKVPRDYDNGQYTFQAILYPDGRIVCQYLNMEFSHHHYSGKGYHWH